MYYIDIYVYTILVYTYIHTCIHTCIYIYIYICIESIVIYKLLEALFGISLGMAISYDLRGVSLQSSCNFDGECLWVSVGDGPRFFFLKLGTS